MFEELIDAIKLHDVRNIKKLLSNPTTKFSDGKEDVLISAVKLSYIEIIKILIKDKRCNPNFRGCKALQLAIRLSRWDICDIIIVGCNLTFILGFLVNEMEYKNFRKTPLFTKITKNFQPFIVSSENDIIALKRRCEEHFECDTYKTLYLHVEYIFDVTIFIKHGFYPDYKGDTLFIEDYIKYKNHPKQKQILDFWNDLPHEPMPFDDLCTCKRWKYIKNREKRALETCESFWISDKPELLYKSKRPVTDMSLFRMNDSLTYKISDIVTENDGIGIIKINGNDHKFIRVTRYAKGMSRGLYYGHNYGEYGGTFYYKEKDSSTLLLYDKERTCKNKFQAMNGMCSAICGRFGEFGTNYLSGKLDLPKDLMMTPSEIKNYVKKHGSVNMKIERYLSELDLFPQEKRYVGKLFGLYAIEDDYDQSIYRTASKEGLCIINFTEMIGSRQLVFEVLDVRERKVSFKNLVFLEN